MSETNTPLPNEPEEWLWIPGHEGRYQVSSLGRVRSVPHIVMRRNRGPFPVKGQILAYNIAPSGHPWVRVGGKMRTVHRLVLLAFVGPLPKGLVSRHLNGIPTDCRIENLVYGTRTENAQDRLRHGGYANAVKTHCKRGHEFTPENTLIDYRGNRGCRACPAARRAERTPEQIAKVREQGRLSTARGRARRRELQAIGDRARAQDNISDVVAS